jgi:hypothetical protein
MTVTTRTDDELVLAMLDMRDNENMTCQAVADALGLERMQVVGRTNRIIYDPEAVCEGTMPRRWWA